MAEKKNINGDQVHWNKKIEERKSRKNEKERGMLSFDTWI
jgi:hypothetical protein